MEYRLLELLDCAFLFHVHSDLNGTALIKNFQFIAVSDFTAQRLVW